MNILIVALDFKPNTGGIAEHTHELAYHLQKQKESVRVLSRQIDGHECFDCGCPYEVTRFPFRRTGQTKLQRWLASYHVIVDTARAHHADILVSNTLGSDGHICWFASRALRIPYVVLAHGLDVNLHDGWKGFIKRIIGVRWADKVFCNSAFTSQIVESIGVPPERIAVVHPGLSRRFLQSAAMFDCPTSRWRLGLEGKRVVLFLGRLVERKGVDNTLRSIPLVRREVPDITYVIAGDGPYRIHLQALAGELGVQEAVRFVGQIEDEEKGLYYSASDVFVMPNRQLSNGDVEGFGIVFLEAGAYAKPVVGGRSGGAVDAVADGVSGLLVDPCDEKEIASAILRILTDTAYANQLGVQGRKRVERDFAWDSIALLARAELSKAAAKRSR